jgi:hypothetical protein
MDVSKRLPDEKPERDLGKWDAEIEAEFQRITGSVKTSGRHKLKLRLIGAPVGFMSDVCRLTKGRAVAMVALCIYRRTVVCKSRMVTLPTAELIELGVDLSHKRRALIELQQAELIEVEQSRGRTARVTLKWQPRSA